MKTLIFFTLLSVSLSGVAFGWQPYQKQFEGNYIPGLPKPFTHQAPAYTPPVYTKPWSQPGGHQGSRHGTGHIYVTPDYNTQQRDLRDQRSWASPDPNPFANDPRNIFPQTPQPRGYDFHW